MLRLLAPLKITSPPVEEEISDWIYFHDNPRYARDNKPLVRAWDVQTGKELWSRDFSHLGAGGNGSQGKAEKSETGDVCSDHGLSY